MAVFGVWKGTGSENRRSSRGHTDWASGLLCLLVCYYSTLTLLSNLDEKIKCRVRCQNEINPNLLDEMKQAQMPSVLCALK